MTSSKSNPLFVFNEQALNNTAKHKVDIEKLNIFDTLHSLKLTQRFMRFEMESQTLPMQNFRKQWALL